MVQLMHDRFRFAAVIFIVATACGPWAHSVVADQPPKPYFMIAFDTSGSMTTGVPSPNACGYPDTRLGHAKCAVRTALQMYSDRANFGLASFPRQMSSCSGACYASCSYANLPGNSGLDGCGAEPNPAAANSSTRAGANILVPMLADLPGAPSSNLTALLSWVDNDCDGSQEMFANGNSPLNGMLRDMFRYYSSQWVHPTGAPTLSSPLAGLVNGENACRYVNVILIADGDETCDTFPDVVDAAADLWAGFNKDGLLWRIKTHVINFAGGSQANMDAIAAAGGTGTAYSAVNDVQLAQALASIIDQTTWSSVGSGTNGTVRALMPHDDGSGPALFAGGQFTSAGGVAAAHIARWDGLGWSALGSPIDGVNGEVRAMTAFDDGTGLALYAAGSFSSAGGGRANNIARWSGSEWTSLNEGVNGTVNALAVFDDDGAGPQPAALYAGGSFTMAGASAVSRIARWNGTTWAAVGGGVSGATTVVNALKVFSDANGPALFVAGRFTTAGATAVTNHARWNGAAWFVVGTGLPPLTAVNALAVHTHAGAASLYAGMNSTPGVARLSRSTWVSLQSLGGVVNSLYDFDDGYADAAGLYVGGLFPAYANIARLNDTHWSSVGVGTGAASPIHCMSAFGNPPRLYAGGAFNSPTSNIARIGFQGSGPSITHAPTNLSVDRGETAVFRVGVAGDALAYQWRRNGVNLVDDVHIVGATSAVLTISPVSNADAGSYDVVVNGCGAIVAGPATLKVLPTCPADIAPPQSPDGSVNVSDLLLIISNWGACLGCPPTHCPSDIAPIVGGVSVGDCQINVRDLLAVVSNWGACP